MEINSQKSSNPTVTFTGIYEYVRYVYAYAMYIIVYSLWNSPRFERTILIARREPHIYIWVNISRESCFYINYNYLNLELFLLIKKGNKKNYITKNFKVWNLLQCIYLWIFMWWYVCVNFKYIYIFFLLYLFFSLPYLFLLNIYLKFHDHSSHKPCFWHNKHIQFINKHIQFIIINIYN